jgi:hypothetical protein
MALQVFVFLLVVFLLSLARLGRLDWFPLRSSSSRGGVKRTRLPRLLKPRTPDGCPSCRLTSTPSSGRGPASEAVRPWREVKSRRGAVLATWNTRSHGMRNEFYLISELA